MYLTAFLFVISLEAKALLSLRLKLDKYSGNTYDWNRIADCSSPLGMIDGSLYDWQLSASSNKDEDRNCNVKYARVHSWPGRGWCPRTNLTNHQYLQIDLGIQTAINGIITQGRADGKSWIKSYYLLFSDDAVNWQYYNQYYNQYHNQYYNSRDLVLANNNSHSLQFVIFSQLVMTRFIRIEVISWHNSNAGLRIELLGCRQCDAIINYPPRSVHLASSSRDWPNLYGVYSADDAYIDGSLGWSAKWNNYHQWITVDVGPPAKIVGVITRGSGAPFKRHWVSSYSISYSNDSLRWIFYKEDHNLTQIKTFDANMDKDTRRWHYLNRPIIARFIRFNPITWKTRIAMRIGVIGCLIADICPNGFFRVNNNSECVQNLSFHRNTWINDKRHSWSGLQFGNSNYAVDGEGDSHKSVHKCAVLDNYFVSTPIWMVDLGQSHTIHGLVIVSWPQHYLHNHIEKLTIAFDSNAKSLTNANQTFYESLNTCGHITSQQLIISSRIHISCESHAKGRYVYIIAFGGDRHSRLLFSAILCEVYVY